jgi:hypothetical protein
MSIDSKNIKVFYEEIHFIDDDVVVVDVAVVVDLEGLAEVVV